MTFQTADFNAYIEATKKAFGPFAKFNELAARTIERTARYQYEVAGDLLNLGVAQMQAATVAKDLPALLAKQTELATQFVEKNTARSQEAVKLASAAQGEFTAWVDATTAELTKKAA